MVALKNGGTCLFSRVLGVEHLQRRPWQEGAATQVDNIFWFASRVPSRDLQGEKSKVWPSLVVPGNGLAKALFLGSRTLARMKTQDPLIGRRQRLCIVSFLKASLLENHFCRPGVDFGNV